MVFKLHLLRAVTIASALVVTSSSSGRAAATRLDRSASSGTTDASASTDDTASASPASFAEALQGATQADGTATQPQSPSLPPGTARRSAGGARQEKQEKKDSNGDAASALIATPSAVVVQNLPLALQLALAAGGASDAATTVSAREKPANASKDVAADDAQTAAAPDTLTQMMLAQAVLAASATAAQGVLAPSTSAPATSTPAAISQAAAAATGATAQTTAADATLAQVTEAQAAAQAALANAALAPSGDSSADPAQQPGPDAQPAGKQASGSAADANSITGSGTANAPRELTFAAKVKPVAAAQRTPDAATHTAQAGALAANASNTRKSTEPDAKTAQPTDSAPAQLHAAVAAFERNAELDSGIKVQPAPAAEAPAAVETKDVVEPPKTMDSLKDISLQVGTADSQKVQVQVHVVEQTGEVHVAVRTGDSDIAHGLQQGLPELVGKLQESGFHADTWKPADAVSPTSAAAETQNSSNNHSQGGDAGSQSGGSQQESGQRNRNQSDTPRWVQELESSMGGGEKS